MSDQHLLLAHYLSTRICHDLTGPISAINNGAELLEEDMPEIADDAISLMRSSAHEAACRLQYFRMAYGHAPQTGGVALTSNRAIIDDYFTAARITLDWSAVASFSVSYGFRRLFVNLLLIAGQSLMKGGVLRPVLALEEDELLLDINAQAELVQLKSDWLDALNGKAELEPNEPKHIHVFHTLQLIQLAGARLSATQSEGELHLRLHHPATESAAT